MVAVKKANLYGTKVLSGFSLAETGRAGLLPWIPVARYAGVTAWSPTWTAASPRVAKLSLDKTPYGLHSLQSSVTPLYDAAWRVLNKQSEFEVQSSRNSRLVDDFKAFEQTTRREHLGRTRQRDKVAPRLVDRLGRLSRINVSRTLSKLPSPAIGYPTPSLEKDNMAQVGMKTARDVLWPSDGNLRGTNYRVSLREQTTADMAGNKETRSRPAMNRYHIPILRRLQRGSRSDHLLTVRDAPTATWPPHPALQGGLVSPDNGSPIDASQPGMKRAPNACRSGSFILSSSDLSDWLDRHFGDSLLMPSTGTTGPDTRMAPPIAGSALTF